MHWIDIGADTDLIKWISYGHDRRADLAIFLSYWHLQYGWGGFMFFFFLQIRKLCIQI